MSQKRDGNVTMCLHLSYPSFLMSKFSHVHSGWRWQHFAGELGCPWSHRGRAGVPSPGDGQFAVTLTPTSPEKMARAVGPHPGADIPHLFQGREPELLLLLFLFMCQSICHNPGEKGTHCVPVWHIAFGKRSSVESLTIL